MYKSNAQIKLSFILLLNLTLPFIFKYVYEAMFNYINEYFMEH